MAAVRDSILEIAGDLFYREGIRAVGIDRIIAESGAAKATLYRHFPSKEQLVLAYLEDRHHRIISSLLANLEQAARPARDRILQVFEILRGKADTDPFRGCAFLMAVSEFEGVEPISRIAREHKSALKAIFRDAAIELTENPDALSDEIAICYEGALASIMVSRSSAPVDVAMRCVSTLIDAAADRG